MKKNKIVITIAVLVLCTFGVAMMSFAASSGTSYYQNVISRKYLKTLGNGSAKSGKIGVNTRPNVSSAYVTIERANGSIQSSKYFPASNSVTSLTATVPSGELRKIYIKSSSRRAIKGALNYNTTY